MSNQLAAEQLFVGMPMVDQTFDFCSTNDTSGLTGTAIASGTATLVSVPNGVLRLSGVATTANTGYELQESKGVVDLEAGGIHSVVSRFKVSSDTDPILLFGLAVIDTTLIGSAPTDGIYLSKATATDDINLIVRTGSATISTNLVESDLDTNYHVWGIEIECKADPTKALVTVYKDGKIAFQDNLTGLASTAALAMSFAFQSGNATGTQTCDLDLLRRRSTRVAN